MIAEPVDRRQVLRGRQIAWVKLVIISRRLDGPLLFPQNLQVLAGDRPGYRRRGYGLRLWQAATNRLRSHHIGLDGVPAQQSNYARSGFRYAHRSVRYRAQAWADVIHDSVRPAAEVAFEGAEQATEHDVPRREAEREIAENVYQFAAETIGPRSHAMDEANRLGIPVFLNLEHGHQDPDILSRYVKRATLCQAVTDPAQRGSCEPLDVAHKLLEAGAKTAIITLAGEGCLVVRGNRSWRVWPPHVQVVDGCGAGATVEGETTPEELAEPVGLLMAAACGIGASSGSSSAR